MIKLDRSARGHIRLTMNGSDGMRIECQEVARQAEVWATVFQGEEIGTMRRGIRNELEASEAHTGQCDAPAVRNQSQKDRQGPRPQLF